MPSFSRGLRETTALLSHLPLYHRTTRKRLPHFHSRLKNTKIPCNITHYSTEQTPNLPYSERDAIHSSAYTSTQAAVSASSAATSNKLRENLLPIICPGCGALSQTINHDEAGFYTSSRKAVKKYLQIQIENIVTSKDGSIANAGTEFVTEGELPVQTLQSSSESSKTEIPICDRCHDLLYNNKGRSIAHPTIENVADIIAESPFRNNHVFHVIDAADFPMSFVPRLFGSLDLARPRSRNRRARLKFTKRPTMSFIITRADLLGPSKAMVDRLMPYFQDGLRSALGKEGRNIRLGNIHLVSAKRGWWTRELKDEIWVRGGGNWMFGKVNVGKSNLFPVLFPKCSGGRAPVYVELHEKRVERRAIASPQADPTITLHTEHSMLPPSGPEAAFPAMPIVSHLPGTTASPIRLSFGNHRGELIDLPGLDRGHLEQHVHNDYKSDLVMQHRPNVTQVVIKPGQSLLVGGGLIRVTPELDDSDSSTTMLAYPFIPLDVHVTATSKAIAMQAQDHGGGVQSILADGAGSNICSSGVYRLHVDVTRSQAMPLLRAGVPLSKIPFRVYSCDILIEGVGWIELVCQVRRRKKETKIVPPPDVSDHDLTDGQQTDSNQAKESVSNFEPFSQQRKTQADLSYVDGFAIPKVEIFSPMGKHIGHRKPLGAWRIWSEAQRQRQKRTTVPRARKPMKGVKKRTKLQERRAIGLVSSNSNIGLRVATTTD